MKYDRSIGNYQMPTILSNAIRGKIYDKVTSIEIVHILRVYALMIFHIIQIPSAF